jgi:UDP-N-acetylglucosamine--N-acetylmuramyl-(pentapeptide) pyrophosphoryl-undecaprenol N-acetylglucosamine transferase
MKICFTGAGSGGHFYPNIAVAQALYQEARERKLLAPELHYIATNPFDERRLFDYDITFHRCPAGKARKYFSPLNIIDTFKTLIGIVVAFGILFRMYPDVILSKGGYASMPVVTAAWLLRIPVVAHESDTIAGRANQWIASYARKIAVAWPEAASYFPEDKVAAVGNPVQQELFEPITDGSHEYFALDESLPTIFVIGGSQGAQSMNDIVLESLPELLPHYQIIHQVGPGKRNGSKESAAVIMADDTDHSARYHPIEYLDLETMRRAAGIANLVISRAGSGAIFEIAAWGLPSILIPLDPSVSRDQRENAFAFARAGATSVMEQHNVTPHLLSTEVNRIMGDGKLYNEMQEAAAGFATPDAAKHIAAALVNIGLEHE